MKKLFLALVFALWPIVAFADPVGQPVYFQSSASAEGSHVFTGKNLYSITISWNSATSARYLMVFDATTLPGNGSTTTCNSSWTTGCLLYCGYVTSSGSAPGSTLYGGTPPTSAKFGIVAALSTGAGCGTLTVDGSNDFFYGQIN